MTLAIIFLTITAVVVATVFTVVRLTHGGITSLMWKTFASFLFVCLGVVVAFAHPQGNIGMFLVLGLIAGMLGDILLDLKSVDSTRSKSYMNFGMLAFGIGHAFYIVFATMLNVDANLSTPLIIAGVCATLFTVAVVFFSKQILGLSLGKFLAQASSYACILTFTAVFAVALAFVNAQMTPFAIAMSAFWISDMILALMYFGGKQSSKVLSVTNHVLYYGAQITIALFMITL